MYEEIKSSARGLFEELIDKAGLKAGDIVVLGCSTSEICGEKIGTGSDFNAADALYDGFYPLLREKGIYLAAQCCEHLNRALVVEKSLAERERLEIVNAVPQPKAGGSSATAAYKRFAQPALVEHIRADAGVDIGMTLIGMHLKEVAVPLRLSVSSIGSAPVVCARTRPKFIGGSRAVYDENRL